MKWILLGLAVVIGFAVLSGYTGGAKNATQNYVSVRTGAK